MATALLITDDVHTRRRLRTQLAQALHGDALDVASAGLSSVSDMIDANHPALADVAVVMVGLCPADYLPLVDTLGNIDAPVVVLGPAHMDDARARFPGADAYLSRGASAETLAALAQMVAADAPAVRASRELTALVSA